jgi:hypothetical protein
MQRLVAKASPAGDQERYVVAFRTPAEARAINRFRRAAGYDLIAA